VQLLGRGGRTTVSRPTGRTDAHHEAAPDGDPDALADPDADCGPDADALTDCDRGTDRQLADGDSNRSGDADGIVHAPDH
jgi:hypothetical protein